MSGPDRELQQAQPARSSRADGSAATRVRPSEPASPLQRLQQTAGNSAVVALLAAGQAKLAVGAADDPYEREADAVARQVLSALRSGSSSGVDEETAGPVVSRLQRRAAPEVGAEGGDLSADTERAINSARSGGQPLADGMRTGFERAFGGTDFSGVRVHTGAESAALNNSIAARAFTIGSDIFLGSGTPDLGSSAGRELLAHELTHTIQQGGGRRS